LFHNFGFHSVPFVQAFDPVDFITIIFGCFQSNIEVGVSPTVQGGWRLPKTGQVESWMMNNPREIARCCSISGFSSLTVSLGKQRYEDTTRDGSALN
jgi:hypothetical protein